VSSDPLHVWFYGGVFGNGGLNGAISGWIKSKMVASGHFEKLQMAISQQRIVRSTLCLVLGWGFRGQWIERLHFWLDQIQDGGWRPFWKIQAIISLKRIIRFTLCMHTDHTLPSDYIMTVDTYVRVKVKSKFIKRHKKLYNKYRNRGAGYTTASHLAVSERDIKQMRLELAAESWLTVRFKNRRRQIVPDGWIGDWTLIS